MDLIKVDFLMVQDQELEYINTLMVLFMMVNGKIILAKGLVKLCFLMVIFIKDMFSQGKNMGKENTNFMMDQCMMDSLCMVLEKALGSLLTIIIGIKENG